MVYDVIKIKEFDSFEIPVKIIRSKQALNSNLYISLEQKSYADRPPLYPLPLGGGYASR